MLWDVRRAIDAITPRVFVGNECTGNKLSPKKLAGFVQFDFIWL